MEDQIKNKSNIDKNKPNIESLEERYVFLMLIAVSVFIPITWRVLLWWEGKEPKNKLNRHNCGVVDRI